MKRTLKKLFAGLVLIVFVIGYCVAIATVAGAVMAQQHWSVQILFFMFAGIIWAPVLKPIMVWLNR